MKLQLRKAWAGVVLALGIATATGASAESLAGLGMQYKYVSPLSFVTNTPGCGQGSYPTMYANCPGVTGGVLYIAPLELPEGAQITAMYLWYYMNSTTNLFNVSISAAPNQFAASGPAPDDRNLDINLAFSGTTVSANNQWRMATMIPYGTVVFNSWDTTSSPGNTFFRSYDVYAWLPANDTNVKFSGVLMAYKRQIAPAPATASFSDIPTNHPFFNEVEQLKKSGITLGCGNGQFCPDSPVTRGQMAAFLSRAFGLQWNPPV